MKTWNTSIWKKKIRVSEIKLKSKVAFIIHTQCKPFYWLCFCHLSLSTSNFHGQFITFSFSFSKVTRTQYFFSAGSESEHLSFCWFYSTRKKAKLQIATKTNSFHWTRSNACSKMACALNQKSHFVSIAAHISTF